MKQLEREYSVYSEFDINKHAEIFIDYLEIAIDSKGKAHYAVPSHQMFLENIIKQKLGIKKFLEVANDLDWSNDYLVWLCDQTNYCLVWNNFYVCGSNGLTKEQKDMLVKLSQTKYKQINLNLYQGKLS